MIGKGPASAGVFVTDKFHFYKEGVFECSGLEYNAETNHAILVVGVVKDDYYIIKNSWSKYWGEKGFIRLNKQEHKNCNLCLEEIYVPYL